MNIKIQENWRMNQVGFRKTGLIFLAIFDAAIAIDHSLNPVVSVQPSHQ
jgi:hypothetical protein